jgi:hypothetical protein
MKTREKASISRSTVRGAIPHKLPNLQAPAASLLGSRRLSEYKISLIYNALPLGMLVANKGHVGFNHKKHSL